MKVVTRFMCSSYYSFLPMIRAQRGGTVPIHVWNVNSLAAAVPHHRAHVLARAAERLLAPLEAVLGGAVLDLDHHGLLPADLLQRPEERHPVDVAQAGDLRHVPPEAQDAAPVQELLVDPL